MRRRRSGQRAVLRPLFFCVLLAVLCVAFAVGWALATSAAKPSRVASQGAKPNIIFILTDDLSWNLVQYMPNLLAMQKDGTTFSSYFVTNSLCCPSRASIFTGKFPHNTGVLTNTPPEGGYEGFNAHGNESQTFAVALQRGGYRTALLGKYLNTYLPERHGVPKGWNEWNVAGRGYPEFNYDLNQNGRVVHYGSQPKDYLTDVLAGLADAFVRKSSQGPFFVEIATFAPHSPYIPAPRDAERFPGLTAPRTAAFGARPGPNAPRWLRSIPPLTPDDIKLLKIDEYFRMRAQSVQAVDQMIGQLRSTLAALGLDSNTYLVFSSDNGLHMGEYSLPPGKMTPFDIDIRVPLIVVGPGVAKGQVVSAIAQNIDLCPTFTELGGTSSPTAPDGRSLVALLKGNAVPGWRHMALIEHHRPDPDPSDPDVPLPYPWNPTSYAALRTENALYVEYTNGEIGYYDLTRDPEALINIAPSLPAATRERWREVLRANTECRGAQACWAAQRLSP